MPAPQVLELRNPHSVLAALAVRPRDVLEVRFRGLEAHGAWQSVAAQAGRRGVAVRFGVEPPGGRRRPRRPNQRDDVDEGGRVGAALALVRPLEGVALDVLFAPRPSPAPVAGTVGDVEPGAVPPPTTVAPTGDHVVADALPHHGVWLALDCLQDPHNVGAIFRAAAFFGVRGIVATKDRSAPLNATVYDVASGGLEHVPFSVQANLARALDAARRQGLWVLGTSEHAPRDLRDVPRDRSWLVVVGNEEHGLRRLVREKCDDVCRIAGHGAVGSLNVSVAAGILMHALTAVPE